MHTSFTIFAKLAHFLCNTSQTCTLSLQYLPNIFFQCITIESTAETSVGDEIEVSAESLGNQTREIDGGMMMKLADHQYYCSCVSPVNKNISITADDSFSFDEVLPELSLSPKISNQEEVENKSADEKPNLSTTLTDDKQQDSTSSDKMCFDFLDSDFFQNAFSSSNQITQESTDLFLIDNNIDDFNFDFVNSYNNSDWNNSFSDLSSYFLE